MLLYLSQYDEGKVLFTAILLLAIGIQTKLVSTIILRDGYKKEFLLDYILFVIINLIFIIVCTTYLLHKMPYIMENRILENNYFIAIVIISLILIFLRSPVNLIKILKENKNFLNNMSIREAIDNLDTGILVFSKKGSVILINEKMKDLLRGYLGQISRNGAEIWNGINMYCDLEKTDCIRLDNSLVLRSEGSAYEFSKEEIKVDGKIYLEVIAVDVTQIDKKIRTLEEKNKEIARLLEEYLKLKANIKGIVDKRLKIRMKMNLHDTLGHQLSMIQAVTASEKHEEISLEKLNILKLLDIFSDNSIYQPEDQLKDMRSFFENLGINIYIEGKLPNRIEIAETFIDIIREATTNAIIHSGAINIDIFFEEHSNRYELIVINDGDIPSEDIVEGGGIKGMRHKIEGLNGYLYIDHRDKFKITVTVPKIIFNH